MKATVYFIDFHWDNHQGGSGKNYSLQVKINIPDDLAAKEVLMFILEQVDKHIKYIRPFSQDNKYSIQKIEIS